jgi:glycosyltransferase involved in cell wall biosynthesis
VAALGNPQVGVSIVVPCFNEEASLFHLHNQIEVARPLLKERYDVGLILVDDGSTDRTWPILRQLFGNQPNCTLIRHASNLGLGAAILTGIRVAPTEIVCSIDCDCTYDPSQLARLLPVLSSSVDLVTGSPYHPDGQVLGVPRWRLFLSKMASSLYRCVLRQQLHTYTSCCRVYRRSVVLQLELKRQGFLGIAELIGKIDLNGFTIAECPATLTARAHGASKMKTARVLAGHFSLLCELLVLRGRRSLPNFRALSDFLRLR